jgi:hypothetical protein
MKSLQQGEKDSHRYTFRNSFTALTGKDVKVELLDGSLLKGILHAAFLFDVAEKCQIVLKAAELLEAGNSAPEVIPGSSIILEFVKIVSVQGKPAPIAKAATNEFKTDAATKRNNISHLQGRELEGVSNAWLDPSTSTSLESSGNAGWDQFEANRRLFNVQSSYDENLYTKKLDVNKLSLEAVERAERIAREIEGNIADNVHLREERGQLNEGEIDEEALYSGVIRENYPAPESGSWRNTGGAPTGGSSKSNAGRGAWDRKLPLDNAGRNSGTSSKSAGSPSTNSNAYPPVQGRRTGPSSAAQTPVTTASPATRGGKTLAPPALAPPAASPVVASAASSAPKPSSSAPPGLMASPVKSASDAAPAASASTGVVPPAATIAEDGGKKAPAPPTTTTTAAAAGGAADAVKVTTTVAPTLAESATETPAVETADAKKPLGPALTPASASGSASAPPAPTAPRVSKALNANAPEFKMNSFSMSKFGASTVGPSPAPVMPMGMVPSSTQFGLSGVPLVPPPSASPAPSNAGAYGYGQHQAPSGGNPVGAANYYAQGYHPHPHPHSHHHPHHPHHGVPHYNPAANAYYPVAPVVPPPVPAAASNALVAPTTPAPAGGSNNNSSSNNNGNVNSVTKSSVTSQPSTPSLAGMPPPPPSNLSRESPSMKPMMSPQIHGMTAPPPPPQTPPVYVSNASSSGNTTTGPGYPAYASPGHHTPHTPITTPNYHAQAMPTSHQTPSQATPNAMTPSWQAQPQDMMGGMNAGAPVFTPVQATQQPYPYYPAYYNGSAPMYADYAHHPYYASPMATGAPVAAAAAPPGAQVVYYSSAQPSYGYLVPPNATATPTVMPPNQPTNATTTTTNGGSNGTNVTSSPATNAMNGGSNNNSNNNNNNTSAGVNNNVVVTPNSANSAAAGGGGNANVGSNPSTPMNAAPYMDAGGGGGFVMFGGGQAMYVPTQSMAHQMQAQAQVPVPMTLQGYPQYVQQPQQQHQQQHQQPQQQQQPGTANAVPYLSYPATSGGVPPQPQPQQPAQQQQHIQMIANNAGYPYMVNPNVPGGHPGVGMNVGAMYNGYAQNGMMPANGGVNSGDKRNRTSVGGRGGGGRGNYNNNANNSNSNNNRGPRSYNNYNNNNNNNNNSNNNVHAGNANANHTAQGIQAEAGGAPTAEASS